MGTARQGRAEVWAGRSWACGRWSRQVEQVGRQGRAKVMGAWAMGRQGCAHLGEGGPRYGWGGHGCIGDGVGRVEQVGR